MDVTRGEHIASHPILSASVGEYEITNEVKDLMSERKGKEKKGKERKEMEF